MRFIFLHLIADYGIGDPAFAEVIQRIKSLEPNLEVLPTSVPPFSTLATGFWIAQLGLYQPFGRMAIYANTDPRKDRKKGREENEGEKSAYALLDNDIPVIAVNAGFCFSFVVKRIKKFCLVNVANKGSQFRSRDFFPEAVVGILKGEKRYLGEKLPTETIPTVPKNLICFVDGYGNLKTTCQESDLPKELEPGNELKIRINRDVRRAIFTNGTFCVREGELAFAPGSSGPPDDRFMEILLRGDSAYRLFEKPQVGTEFHFEKRASFLWR